MEKDELENKNFTKYKKLFLTECLVNSACKLCCLLNYKIDSMKFIIMLFYV